MFVMPHANRDSHVFSHPTHFDPDRWARSENDSTAGSKRIFTYGAGSRDCIGKFVTDPLLAAVL